MRARGGGGGGGGGRAGGGKLHERVEQIVSQLQIRLRDTDSLPGAITEARTRLGLSPGGGRALIELVAEVEQEIQRHPLPDLYDERAEPERWHATEVMRSDSDDDDDDDDDFQSADEDERECGVVDKVAECDRLVEEEHAFLDCAKAYDWAGVERTLGTQPELVNVQPSGRWSALHQAASADDAQAVAMLLHFHADPRLRDADSNSLAVDSAWVASSAVEVIDSMLDAAGGSRDIAAALLARPPQPTYRIYSLYCSASHSLL